MACARWSTSPIGTARVAGLARLGRSALFSFATRGRAERDATETRGSILINSDPLSSSSYASHHTLSAPATLSSPFPRCSRPPMPTNAVMTVPTFAETLLPRQLSGS